MKLYTEEQVRWMLDDTNYLTPSGINYHMDTMTPIKLPSDEEIEECKGSGMHDAFNAGFEQGAKWVIEQIKQQGK